MNLYEITQEIHNLDSLLESEQIDTDTYSDTMEIVKYELEKKADGLIKYFVNIDTQIEIIDSEIKRLQDLKKSKNNKVDRLKKYIVDNILLLNKTKVETPLGNFSIRKSESVEVDMSMLHTKYLKQKIEYSADKIAIKEAIKKGEKVDGATIIENKNLIIK
jgi:hypothetical protein